MTENDDWRQTAVSQDGDGDPVAAVLSGSAGRKGLSRLVDGSATQQLVRVTVEHAAGVAVRPGASWRAERVAWKPHRRLRVFSTVPTTAGPLAVAVRWELERRRVAGPVVPIVECWPDDAAWPHLREAIGPATAAEVLAAAGWDGAGRPEVTVLRYRPAQRHVVRLQAGGQVAYLKVGEAATTSARRAVAEALADACRTLGAHVADPVWASDRLGAIASAAVAGTVRRPGPVPDAADLAHLARMGAFLRGLHALEPLPGLPVGPDAADETATTRRACEHAVRLSPGLQPVLDDVLGASQELAGRPAVQAPSHGDAKLEHLLDAGGRLAVIDLDSGCLADPLRDLARLLASVRWETGADGWPVAAQALLAAYDPERTVDRLALRGWTALALVKQAARRVPVLDPELPARLGAWLAVAAAICAAPRP